MIENNRIDWLDYAKGVGMILVYIGHMHYNYTPLKTWIYSFHMPLFFFISGFLYKANWGGYIRKKSRKLLMPYLFFSIFNIVLLLLAIYCFHSNECIYDIYYPKFLLTGWGRNPLWFIPVLFFIEVLHYYITGKNSLYKFMALGVIIALVICNFIVKWMPYCVLDVPKFYLFFLTGVLYKKMPNLQLIQLRPVLYFVCLSVSLLALLQLPYIPSYKEFIEDGTFAAFLRYYLMGVVGTLAILCLCVSIDGKENVIHNYFKRLLRWIGRNSLTIMATHLLFIDILYFPTETISLIMGQLVAVGAVVSSVFFYNKYVQKLITNSKIVN